MEATEELVVKGLVDGELLKTGKQLYYSGMKFKFKGKQEAILERKRKRQLDKESPERAKEADAIAAEINRGQAKPMPGGRPVDATAPNTIRKR